MVKIKDKILYWLVLTKTFIVLVWDNFIHFCKSEYRIAQYHNQLTDEIYFYIEKRTLCFWRTEKINSSVFQKQFGCDKDGMFGQYEKVIPVLRFLRGELKLVKTIRE